MSRVRADLICGFIRSSQAELLSPSRAFFRVGSRRQAVVDAKGADSGATISLTLTDVTQQSGIQFTHNNGAFGGKLLPETMGAGLAFLDYDGDGDQDLFLVNGRDWTEAEVAAFKSGSGRDMAASPG